MAITAINKRAICGMPALASAPHFPAIVGLPWRLSLKAGIYDPVEVNRPIVGEKVEPDFVLYGVPDEYWSMVETRVIETESEGLLFVINRGLDDHALEVAVKGYKPINAKVGMYSVTKQLLN